MEGIEAKEKAFQTMDQNQLPQKLSLGFHRDKEEAG